MVTRQLLTVTVQSRSGVFAHQHCELMSSLICCCGCSFTTPAALKNHSKGCDKNKKHLVNVLVRAQELFNTKRCCLCPDVPCPIALLRSCSGLMLCSLHHLGMLSCGHSMYSLEIKQNIRGASCLLNCVATLHISRW